MKSEKMTQIDRAISIIGSIPNEEKFDKSDFLSAVARYLESQLKINGKSKDPAKGYKYKTAYMDPTTGEKRAVRFKLKNDKISIRLNPSKKEKDNE